MRHLLFYSPFQAFLRCGIGVSRTYLGLFCFVAINSTERPRLHPFFRRPFFCRFSAYESSLSPAAYRPRGSFLKSDDLYTYHRLSLCRVKAMRTAHPRRKKRTNELSVSKTIPGDARKPWTWIACGETFSARAPDSVEYLDNSTSHATHGNPSSTLCTHGNQ